MANKASNINDNPGSTENQVIILTDRITVINTHLKINKKWLKYLKRINLEGYKSLIEKLNIRK